MGKYDTAVKAPRAGRPQTVRHGARRRRMREDTKRAMLQAPDCANNNCC